MSRAASRASRCWRALFEIKERYCAIENQRTQTHILLGVVLVCISNSTQAVAACSVSKVQYISQPLRTPAIATLDLMVAKRAIQPLPSRSTVRFRPFPGSLRNSKDCAFHSALLEEQESVHTSVYFALCGYGTSLLWRVRPILWTRKEEHDRRCSSERRTQGNLLLACAAHTYLCRYTPSSPHSPSLLNPTPSPLRRYATLVAFLWGMARWSCASQRSLLACCLAVVLLASLLRATPARAVPDREPFHSPGRPDDDGSSVGLASHGAWP